MKYIKIIRLILVAFFITSMSVNGQECENFHKLGDCQLDVEKPFEIFGQSRSDMIGVGYTLKYNIIFYGKKEYLVSFCTTKDYYPIHFKLIDPISEDILYDNEDDDYLESVGFGVEKTRQFTIEMSILGDEATDQEIEDYFTCVGMLIQGKPIK